jgi:hypothetical protein
MVCVPKVFKTGSRGWHCSAKAIIGDERVQVSLCITVVGSKAEQKAPVETKQDSATVQKRIRTRQEATRQHGEGEILSDGKKALEITGELPRVS